MKSPLKLHIPQPCHESWNNMTPKEQGRFCGSCSKIVVDFSVMTDRQMLEYFSNYSGSTCGRFTNDQLNRVIDHKVRKPSNWFKYMLGALLPAIFVAGKSYGQGAVAMVKAETIECKPKTVGRVKTVKQVKNVKPAKVALPEKLSATEIDIPVVNAVNLPEPAPRMEDELTSITVGAFVSEIEIVEEPVFHQFKRFIADAISGQSFALFPNPAKAGGAMNISYQLKKGNYIVQVIDINGRVLQQQEINLGNKSNSIEIRLAGYYASGQYMLVLADNRRRKIGAKPFIIQ